MERIVAKYIWTYPVGIMLLLFTGISEDTPMTDYRILIALTIMIGGIIGFIIEYIKSFKTKEKQ
jgi:hypothetical protein